MNHPLLDLYHEACEAERAGRHAEALAHLERFYSESAAVPACMGMRLTFALHTWGLLAQAYPPAHAALAALRERVRTDVVAASLDHDAFVELVNLNHELGDDADTVRLLRTHQDSLPVLPPAAGSRVLRALVAAGELALARRYFDSAQAGLGSLAADLNEWEEQWEDHDRLPQPMQVVALYGRIHNAAEELRLCEAILAPTGEQDEARALVRRTLDALASIQHRTLLQKELQTPGYMFELMKQARFGPDLSGS
jgi:tetratricopeptide (TPR) repeat protein